MEGGKLIAKITRGGGSGIGQLFAAEASYATMDLGAAKRYAFGAIFDAAERQQHDIVCNARYVLAKVAFISGDYQEFAGQCEAIRSYVDSRAMHSLHPLRDCALALLCIEMQDFANVPRWIIGLGDAPTGAPPIARGRDQVMRALYLIMTEKHEELLALVDRLEEFCILRGLWYDRLCANIMRAVGYLKLRDERAAMDALWAAYCMSQANEVVAPFIISASHMRALVECARRTNLHPFREDWLDSCHRRASTFAKKRAAMVKEHYKGRGEPAPSQDVKLSKRELEVLGHLSQGLTRRDIAEQARISVNTAKSTITSVYNKLGAVNRADAVRIAASLGLIS